MIEQNLVQPLVTISIPIYKCEEFLEKCLQSVLAQTYQNIEVTLINDQTPDNAVEVAEQFIQRHNLQNWKIYHLEKNSGLSVVRNKGIDTAEGKYLFFLDSDDTITPDCIESMVELAEKENVEMVVGEVRGIRIPKNEVIDIFPIREKEDVLRGNDNVFESFIRGKYLVSSWNKLILLSFLKENQLYFVKGLYAQDSLQSFHTALKMESMAILRKKTYHYYLHSQSVIHNRGKRHFDNWFTIATEMDNILKKETDKKRRKQILEYLISYKTLTLQMNWKAQKNEELWKESYANYKKLSSLSLLDYFSSDYSQDIKKNDFLNSLPTNIGFKIFKKRWEG